MSENHGENIRRAFPNIDALSCGCIRGKASEWIHLQPEANRIIIEYATVLVERDQLRASLAAVERERDEMRDAAHRRERDTQSRVRYLEFMLERAEKQVAELKGARDGQSM